MKRLALNYVLITALICSAVFTSCNVINVKQVLKDIIVEQISIYGGNDGSRNTGGLTITDIPAKFNGMYADFGLISLSEGGIFGRQTLTIIDKGRYKGFYDEITFSRISNGKVTIPAWTGSAIAGFVRYSGDDTLDRTVVSIYSVATSGEYAQNHKTLLGFGGLKSSVTIKFSKGNATLSWNDIAYRDNRDN